MKPQLRKKVLLMGRAGAGKTSMRSIIFANYLARDERRLTPTNNVEHSHLRFLGNLVLSLWDCGGQDIFMENYFESQREHIFRNAEVLIYVIEARINSLEVVSGGRIKHHRDIEKDFRYMKTTFDSILSYSPSAHVFCLLHKMDLIPHKDRQSIIQFYSQMIQKAGKDIQLRLFDTTIWDETLFKAWSQILYSLVPNVNLLEHHLNKLCDDCKADEVVLFEKSTFLVISYSSRNAQDDDHRFEKISNICKQFKLTCGKSQSDFSSVMMKNNDFCAFIERFTKNTYIMMIITDPDVKPAATLCSIDFAREHFGKLMEKMPYESML